MLVVSICCLLFDRKMLFRVKFILQLFYGRHRLSHCKSWGCLIGTILASCGVRTEDKMKKILLVLAIAVTTVILGTAEYLSAATITTFIGNCSTTNCFGSTYTLVIDDAGDNDATTYLASLTINSTGYNGPIASPVFIDAVDIKIVNSVLSIPVLTAAPGGPGNWLTEWNSGQAATDCGPGKGFFACALDPNPNNLAPVPGVYTWTWSFATNSTLSFGQIGASYNNTAGTINGNNTSISNASTVPEPSTLILLGSGLLVLWGWSKRAVCRP
jgi:hypothetical protein